MKLFPNAHATHPQWRMAAALVLAQLQAQMAQPEYARRPSLGLLYITDHFVDAADALLLYLAQQLPMVADWSGTVGVGVVGNNAEYFDEPALSIMLCDLAPAHYRLFSGVAPLPRGAKRTGEPVFAAHTALVHADGGAPDLADLLQELAGRTSSNALFGGVSASRSASIAFARHGDAEAAVGGVLSGGLSGVAFSEQVWLASRVTQDCQPIGSHATVTQAQDNVVLQLDGRPALDVLLDTLGVRLDGDQLPALRALRRTLAGLSSADTPTLLATGHFGADTLVRHIVGLDVSRGGVALAERVQVGMRLAFCQRNLDAARTDLVRICTELREELAPEPPARPAARRICGALYVSCSGRGGAHFGGPSAELQTVHRALGDVPLVGFFASGEIAGHRLHAYTGVLTVFVE